MLTETPARGPGDIRVTLRRRKCTAQPWPEQLAVAFATSGVLICGQEIGDADKRISIRAVRPIGLLQRSHSIVRGLGTRPGIPH